MTDQKPRIEHIIAYAAGEVSDEQAAAMERAMESDPSLALRVDEYARIIGAMRTDNSVEPTPEAIERALAIFGSDKMGSSSSSVPLWSRAFEAIDRVVASLFYDSRAEPALAGYRGAGDAVQLTYEVAGAEIDLEITPVDRLEGPACSIMGQVSSDEEVAGAAVRITSSESGKVAAEARCDESGMFTLEAPCGVYDLLLQLPQRLVAMEGLEVRT